MFMIKICPGIYVHFLTAVLFCVCFIFGKIETLAVTYAVMTVHECVHLCAAVLIGLSPSRMIFFPFGVNLKLKNRIFPSFAEETILYLSGPLANVVMALAAKCFFGKYFWCDDFYRKNILLFFLNIFPVLPLDGGAVLKRIIADVCGEKTAMFVMKIISTGIMVSGGIFFWRKKLFEINFSLIFFFVFLVGNLFTAKEKYNRDLLRGLMFSKENKRFSKARIVVMRRDENLRDVLKEFTNIRYNILCIIGENGEIEKIMSEREVIDRLLSN